MAIDGRWFFSSEKEHENVYKTFEIKNVDIIGDIRQYTYGHGASSIDDGIPIPTIESLTSKRKYDFDISFKKFELIHKYYSNDLSFIAVKMEDGNYIVKKWLEFNPTTTFPIQISKNQIIYMWSGLLSKGSKLVEGLFSRSLELKDLYIRQGSKSSFDNFTANEDILCLYGNKYSFEYIGTSELEFNKVLNELKKRANDIKEWYYFRDLCGEIIGSGLKKIGKITINSNRDSCVAYFKGIKLFQGYFNEDSFEFGVWHRGKIIEDLRLNLSNHYKKLREKRRKELEKKQKLLDAKKIKDQRIIDGYI